MCTHSTGVEELTATVKESSAFSEGESLCHESEENVRELIPGEIHRVSKFKKSSQSFIGE